MLADFAITAVLPAQDTERAHAFYTDVLGLEPLDDPGDDLIRFAAGAGTTIALALTPERVPPKHPAVSIAVRGIGTLVPALKERGAEFVPLSAAGIYSERPDGRVPDVADIGSLRTAFLRDSEGNVLALTQGG